VIATDHGTITTIQGVGLSVRQPGLFQQARQKGSGMRAGQGLETPRAMGIWSFPAGCHGNGL